MSAFKLRTLKQKLWAIVAASFVARVIMFFALPNSPSPLAPDEGTYAHLAKWIGESKPADDFPFYGQGLYLSGRSIIAPASVLYRFGFDELDSVRLVSTTYGFCGLIFVVIFILNLYRDNSADSSDQRRNSHLIVGLVSMFAFLPSHFVWSNLGLRESATEFWTLLAFGFFFMLYYVQKKFTVMNILAFLASIVFTYSSRPQVGWVLGVTLILCVLFTFSPRKSFFMLIIVIGAVFLGSSTSGDTYGQVLNAGEIIEQQQLANQIGAASLIKLPSCPFEESDLNTPSEFRLDTYLCIAWRAPYMISTFLFRPIIGDDVTSSSSLIAALENIIWMFLFVIFSVVALKKRKISFLKPLFPPFVFFILYVSGASAYQGNMGTGFRHKSLILWIVLLLIFAVAWRKDENSGLNSRNNSQESAV
jgi:hypothetical protein